MKSIMHTISVIESFRVEYVMILILLILQGMSEYGLPSHLSDNDSFHGHVCDQKSGNFHFSMATALDSNMLLTGFWLIIVLPVGVKTFISLKIKFFVKVKNRVHAIIGHVCDFPIKWVLHKNDLKVNVIW